MVSHPELGSDQPIGSDRESRYDNPCFWPSFSLFSLLFLSLSRQRNTLFEDDNSKDVWLKPLNLEEEGC